MNKGLILECVVNVIDINVNGEVKSIISVGDNIANDDIFNIEYPSNFDTSDIKNSFTDDNVTDITYYISLNSENHKDILDQCIINNLRVTKITDQDKVNSVTELYNRNPDVCKEMFDIPKYLKFDSHIANSTNDIIGNFYKCDNEIFNTNEFYPELYDRFKIGYRDSLLFRFLNKQIFNNYYINDNPNLRNSDALYISYLATFWYINNYEYNNITKNDIMYMAPIVNKYYKVLFALYEWLQHGAICTKALNNIYITNRVEPSDNDYIIPNVEYEIVIEERDYSIENYDCDNINSLDSMVYDILTKHFKHRDGFLCNTWLDIARSNKINICAKSISKNRYDLHIEIIQ